MTTRVVKDGILHGLSWCWNWNNSNSFLVKATANGSSFIVTRSDLIETGTYWANLIKENAYLMKNDDRVGINVLFCLCPSPCVCMQRDTNQGLVAPATEC